jgi:peptidyl-prolyl cis-trans isomerase A (cyclophilin A)
MKKISLTLLVLLFTITNSSAQTKEICTIKTSLGDITVELYPKKSSDYSRQFFEIRRRTFV